MRIYAAGGGRSACTRALIVALPGGQLLLRAETHGEASAMVFDLSRLNIRPLVHYSDGTPPPDAICVAPPLVLGYSSASRTLRAWETTSGELRLHIQKALAHDADDD